MVNEFFYKQPVRIWFGEVGKLPYLREVTGLTVDNIIKTAKEAVTLK